jgi:hypothetical protein
VSGPGPSGAAAVDGAPLFPCRLSLGYEPIALGLEQVLEGFECRSAEQTSWLRRYARQSAEAGTPRVLVVTETANTGVLQLMPAALGQKERPPGPKLPSLRLGFPDPQGGGLVEGWVGQQTVQGVHRCPSRRSGVGVAPPSP